MFRQRRPDSAYESLGFEGLGFVKRIIFLCVVVSVSLTLSTIPHSRQMLDSIYKDSPIDFVNSEKLNLRGSSIENDESVESECFVHPPMKANFDHVEKVNKTLKILDLPTPAICGSLRRDWNHMPVQSELAREFETHQSNCSLPVITFEVDNNYGLGSHLVLWSQALCNAMEKGFRVRASNSEWLWMDKMYCNPRLANYSPLLCYFPNAENRCADQLHNMNETLPDPRNRKTFCKRLGEGSASYRNDTLSAFRSASMEFLFQKVSPLVVKEAERQIGLLFGEKTPPDMITVHIRWGDKFWEMDLVPIEQYIDAVHEILRKRGAEENSVANIYLACEDPKAVDAFLKAAPNSWNIYVDRTFTELTPYRPSRGNRASWVARNTKGRAGLLALGSLIVALEADDFVLTTSSNWSRLMDYLRRNVIDVRCGNCTSVVDLREGNW